jgi:AsmA protein
MKAIKLIAVIFLLIIALLVAAAIAVVTLVDPNNYKPQIRDAALKQAGIELDIAGDIGWSFYPWLALELNNVGVGYPEKPALGRLARAEISVSIPALLGGQLQMNRVLIDGLQLDLVQTAEGNNWTADAAVLEAVAQGRVAEATADAAQTPPAAETDSGKALAIDIEAVELRNAALTYTDQTSDSRIELSELNLTTGRVSLDQAFPLQLDFALRQFVANELQLNAQAQLASSISLNLAENHYRLDNLTSTLKLIDGAALPTPLELTLAAGIDARINEQQVEITGLSLKADPLTLSGNIKLRNFSQPELSGSLKSNSFNPKQLLTRLGQTAPETADSKALTQASFSADLGGPAGTVLLKPLSLQLDDTRLDGEASFVLATQVVALKLKGNALDADRYLPPAAAQTSGDRGTTAKGGADAASSSGGNGAKTDSTGWPRDEIVPLEPLRALNLSADLDLDSLKVNDINLSKPGLSLTADQGLIRLTRFSAGVFEGQVNATARIDARKAPLQLSVSKQISGVQIGSVLQTLADTDVMAGKFNAKADLSMSGQSIHAWVNSLNGSANIGMAEGLIKGIDAAQSLCQGINNLSALWINAEQVDKTTPFADLGANFSIRNGVVSNQDLKAKLDAIALAGRGSVDLPRQALDYRVGLTIEDNLFNQSCSVNNRLEGVEVPVNCKGGFYDEPAKLCRLDTSFISDIIKAEARRKVEEKVGTQVEDKLKEKLGEEGAGVLKGLFGR